MIIVLIFFGSSFKGFLVLVYFIFRKFFLDLLDAFDQLFQRRFLNILPILFGVFLLHLDGCAWTVRSM